MVRVISAIFLLAIALFGWTFYWFYLRNVSEPSDQARVRAVLATIVSMAEYRKLTKSGLVPAESLPIDGGRNDFPLLVSALGPEIINSVLRAWGPPFQLVVKVKSPEQFYRVVTEQEAIDPAHEKWLLDVWGAPIVYRPNRKPDGRIDIENPLLLYSIGPNGIDEGGHSDDLKAE